MANHWHYCTGRGIDMVGQYVRKGLLMSNRIQELAEQAKFTWVENDKDITGGVDLEKFAELIVKECANRATWAQDTGEKDIGGEILKHFGVEE
jgi:N-acetylglutamate synthase-like GNAT family acetyltransferase